MKWWHEARQIILALDPVDMRKSINGLSILVEAEAVGDLFSGDLFVFCNRRRNMIKVLYWQDNGFCLWLKRLEEHRFKWPKSEADVLKIKLEELDWLLAGLDITQAHEKPAYERVS